MCEIIEMEAKLRLSSTGESELITTAVSHVRDRDCAYYETLIIVINANGNITSSQKEM